MMATKARSAGRPREFDRDEALGRAMEVFWERGYAGASIRALTDAMGLNPPSLYGAFGSKEQLFREALALYNRLEGAATERALREEPTARRAIEAMLRDNVEVYLDPRKPTGCMIVLSATAPTPDNEELRSHLAALRRETHRLIRARLERGVADGDIDARVDLEALAAYLNTVHEGLSIQARDGTSRDELHAVVTCALAGWEALTGPPPARR